MKVLRVKMSIPGSNQLRKSGEVKGLLNEFASAIQARCGEEYEFHPARNGRKRARAIVSADSYKARRDNAKNNTLLKSLGGGR